MGRVKDAEALRKYKLVLSRWRTSGYILWKELPRDWIARNLPNTGTKLIEEFMARHVEGGGKIDQVEERRPEFTAWRFHYDFRLPISNRMIYIETVLLEEEDDEDCTIYVVNAHDA